jgi:hypothetical protein
LLTSVSVASWLCEGIRNEGSLLGTIWMVVGKPLCLSMNLFLQPLTDGGWEHPGHAAAFVCKTQGPTTAIAKVRTSCGGTMEKLRSDHSFAVNPAVKYPQISWVLWKLIGTDFKELGGAAKYCREACQEASINKSSRWCACRGPYGVLTAGSFNRGSGV